MPEPQPKVNPEYLRRLFAMIGNLADVQIPQPESRRLEAENNSVESLV